MNGQPGLETGVSTLSANLSGWRALQDDHPQGDHKGSLYNDTPWQAGSSIVGAHPCGRPETLLVKVRGLKKSYGFKPVLRGVDLTMHAKERVALLGANGAGKTTLLRILACLIKPDRGYVEVDDLDCQYDAQHIRHLVGFVGHQPYLYEELTALENLLFFARMYGIARARERALGLLQRVGLEHRQKERVNTLSRGQVQRLAWARALLHQPRLLLLDEPDTGLDQAGHALVDALLNEHTQSGGGALFTTHQLERALALGDRVVLLSRGRIVYERATAQLTLSELQQRYQEVAQ